MGRTGGTNFRSGRPHWERLPMLSISGMAGGRSREHDRGRIGINYVDALNIYPYFMGK